MKLHAIVDLTTSSYTYKMIRRRKKICLLERSLFPSIRPCPKARLTISGNTSNPYCDKWARGSSDVSGSTLVFISINTHRC